MCGTGILGYESGISLMCVLLLISLMKDFRDKKWLKKHAFLDQMPNYFSDVPTIK